MRVRFEKKRGGLTFHATGAIGVRQGGHELAIPLVQLPQRDHFMSANFSVQNQAVNEEVSQRDVYQSIVSELEQLSADQIQPINVDISTAVTTVLGALPRLVTHRAALAGLSDFDLKRFDKIEVYTRALAHAHRQYLIATQPPDDLRALHEEAVKLREALYHDASVALVRGLLPPGALDDLKGINGYKNTANDLQILAGALQENWTSIQGRCGTTEAELTYADKLAFHLLRTFGVREHGPEGMAQATDMRVRAYTLFFRAYDDARQGIAYVRRQAGDADRIAPSLFSGRSAGRKKEGSAEASSTGNTTDSSALPPVAEVVPRANPGAPIAEMIDPYGP
jgi:hypothetical protein